MIYKGFFPSQIKNRIKEHPEYEIILNYPLKIMYKIAQSMHDTVRATYPYL